MFHRKALHAGPKAQADMAAFSLERSKCCLCPSAIILPSAAQVDPAGQQAARAKPAGVAFDNEAANLAGSVPDVAARPDLEE